MCALEMSMSFLLETEMELFVPHIWGEYSHEMGVSMCVPMCG